ncbi:monovalent cation:proton antiporter-2 (CPA2) family protein [Oceanimonas sp. MB9]|uniref:monovalent cation:proton antiporter-2 (CPA2) family protein n=1 Tax=Oceanimonas sp. MB9 TaxID=2588453 RepID=UPI0013F607A2|nr:monovalent cation:proton antiporter-2 (CPA2) family protein [Oceanimonas sp. MB9]NHI02125.1 Glutathione-regulated potassium-efflux system protein KefC [Oceanimonas sp. MB9]
MTVYFIQAFIYLCAAVITVPLAKRLGMGSVLGYLIAGVIIGPVIGLVGEETETLQHFAEFGVVMMLFLVGLELEPKVLWSMRNRLLGLGGLQVGLTSVAVAAGLIVLGLDWRLATAIGVILSLSSTAIVLQTLNEKGLTRTEGGRGAFSVLLFQDIAVIPILALLPLLEFPALMAAGAAVAEQTAEHAHGSALEHLPNWLYALAVLGAIAGVILGGYFLSRPLFRYVVQSGQREVFTATALMLVIGIAALMSLVGLSPALGTFLAGVVLANSEFRHELESNIEPFKGLLLGLFFITVGASIDFTVLAAEWMLVIAAVIGLMTIKAAIIYVVALPFGLAKSDRWLLALSLAQAGEFGFVLISFSLQNHVIPAEVAQLVALVVAISMFLSPALFIAYEKVLLPRFTVASNTREADRIDEQGKVLIAGVGRFGQIVNRLLVANGIKTTVLDHEAGQVENLRKIGVKSYFGDTTQPELLHAAGIEQCALFVVAIDDKVRAVELVRHVKRDHPGLTVLARAHDRGHLYELQEAGADHVVKETYHSALALGGEALTRLGLHPFRVEQKKFIFHSMEDGIQGTMYQDWKATAGEGRHLTNYRQLFLELEVSLRQAMERDRADNHAHDERGWAPPPKGYDQVLKEADKTASEQ